MGSRVLLSPLINGEFWIAALLASDEHKYSQLQRDSGLLTLWFELRADYKRNKDDENPKMAKEPNCGERRKSTGACLDWRKVSSIILSVNVCTCMMISQDYCWLIKVSIIQSTMLGFAKEEHRTNRQLQ